MNVLDLFSGIGGFSIGLERAGMRTVAFCEIDPAARIILGRHWPGVSVYDDVRAVTAARLSDDGIGPIDVVCGGFPCQDISVAGNGAGLAGERSGLWTELARIIGDVRPRFVVVENVGALLSGGDHVRYPIDRCVCGRPYRRRGVPVRQQGQDGERNADVHGAVRCRDVSEGAPDSAEVARAIRGVIAEAAGRNGPLGSCVALGSDRDRGQTSLCGTAPASATEGRAGAVADESDPCRRGGDPSLGDGVEPEGSDDDPDDGVVCPACGRAVVDAPTGSGFVTWMGRVLGDLAALGYDAEWACIPAAAVGAPHRRDRVWIVAADADRGGFQGIGQSQHGQQQRAPRGEPDRLGARGWRDGAADVADAERERREVGCRLLGPFARALAAASSPWERPAEPPLLGMDDGVPGWAHRIRCLGNAVVPQIPEIIGRELMALAAGEPQT